MRIVEQRLDQSKEPGHSHDASFLLEGRGTGGDELGEKDQNKFAQTEMSWQIVC